MSKFRSRYKSGERVEVRPREEILAMLDDSGSRDSLPFMPEMLQFCGKRFTVFASAHKTCDTVKLTGCRRMEKAVHLDGVRCDGSAHGGCQANCLIFWKDDWLKPVVGDESSLETSRTIDAAHPNDLLARNTRSPDDDPEDPTYVCQATRMYEATVPLETESSRQYVDDIASGNVNLPEATKILVLDFIYNLRNSGRAFRLAKKLYEIAHRVLRGRSPPFGTGRIPIGEATPTMELNLQVGEIVRVRPHEEILATLNVESRNRGMTYDKEMTRYCGEEFRVAARVSHTIDETNGKMLEIRSPAVILEGTYCTSQYSERRLMCPRRIVPYWREIWLERIHSPDRVVKS